LSIFIEKLQKKWQVSVYNNKPLAEKKVEYLLKVN